MRRYLRSWDIWKILWTLASFVGKANLFVTSPCHLLCSFCFTIFDPKFNDLLTLQQIELFTCSLIAPHMEPFLCWHESYCYIRIQCTLGSHFTLHQSPLHTFFLHIRFEWFFMCAHIGETLCWIWVQYSWLLKASSKSLTGTRIPSKTMSFGTLCILVTSLSLTLIAALPKYRS